MSLLPALSPFEQRRLAECELAVFQGKLVFQARDPAPPAVLERLRSLCSGPLPSELLELLGTCLGGRLDYDLPVTLGDRVVDLGFTELFYPGSDHYQDLWEWIEYEQESSGQETLDFLPFGGFEYCDRVYVQVRPGEGHGQVVAWKQGFPPAWELGEDRARVIAPGVRALFDQLRLCRPPGPESPTGREALEAVEAVSGEDPASQNLRRKLRGLILGEAPQ